MNVCDVKAAQHYSWGSWGAWEGPRRSRRYHNYQIHIPNSSLLEMFIPDLVLQRKTVHMKGRAAVESLPSKFCPTGDNLL